MGAVEREMKGDMTKEEEEEEEEEGGGVMLMVGSVRVEHQRGKASVRFKQSATPSNMWVWIGRKERGRNKKEETSKNWTISKSRSPVPCLVLIPCGIAERQAVRKQATCHDYLQMVHKGTHDR